jgi:hypothetical protein
MRTLGIDLSTAETQTAACELHWDGVEGRDLGGPPRLGLADGPLLALMAGADTIGIDAPFGWPDAFRAAIDAWSEHDTWPAGDDRRPLRLRVTDEVLATRGRTPMSVRCAAPTSCTATTPRATTRWTASTATRRRPTRPGRWSCGASRSAGTRSGRRRRSAARWPSASRTRPTSS